MTGSLDSCCNKPELFETAICPPEPRGASHIHTERCIQPPHKDYPFRTTCLTRARMCRNCKMTK